MSIEGEKDILGLKRIGGIVARALRLMRESTVPGMTTRELDEIGARYLREHGARSAPQLTYNFPGATCISLNHEVAHGIPGSRRIEAGDLINVDVSAELGGYFADTGGSYVVPPVAVDLQRLCDATEGALAAGVAVVRAGQPLNAIGRAVEAYARAQGYTLIRNLCSHGVGRALHEEPKEIPTYYDPRDRRMLTEGLVITIEPFLSNGAQSVFEAHDGWTLKTTQRYRSAQFEHTMIVTNGDPIIVTAA
jgi:methionyl aminopeptidase